MRRLLRQGGLELRQLRFQHPGRLRLPACWKRSMARWYICMQ